jgi:cell division protein FtsL
MRIPSLFDIIKHDYKYNGIKHSPFAFRDLTIEYVIIKIRLQFSSSLQCIFLFRGTYMNIKRKYSHLTRIIRDKLMKVTLMVKIVLVFIVVIMFSSSVISLISYYKISKFIQEKNNIFAQNLCATIMNSIDSQIKDMDRISKIILGNPDIQRILSESQEENYDNYNKIRDFAIIRDLAISIMSVSDRIRVSIYHKDGNAYFIEPNVYSKIHSNLLIMNGLKLTSVILIQERCF